MEKHINFKGRQKQSDFGFGKIVMIIFVIAVLAVIGLYLWYNYQISKPLSNSGQMVSVDIEEGENRDQIAQKLKGLGIIDNTDIFVWYVKLSGNGSKIKSGGHNLRRNLNIKELVETLEQNPDETTVWVTIPEGIRMDEIGKILDKAFTGKKDKKFDKAQFIEITKNPNNTELNADVKAFLNTNLPAGKPMEGFLYPDTYNFFADATTEQVISKQVTTLMEKLETIGMDKIEASKFNLYEIITIASMLEREAYTEAEARIIADIIVRRLEQGYFLGIDATTLYELKDWKADLNTGILNQDTPYNTRKRMGLPPTPISNPNKTTIEALINPTPNEYFYYLHDSENKVYYAKTNAEHEANKIKYL